MQQRHLGRSGLRVSRVGLGTLTWGRDTDEHEARDQLKSFVEAARTRGETAVPGEDGVRAMRAAEMVIAEMRGHRWA